MTVSEQRPSPRPARADDAPAVVELLAQLGYADDEEHVRARLDRLGARADADVLVIEVHARVVAVVAYQLIEVLERAQPQCRITTLVVHESHRRQGLAHALVSAVQRSAEHHGCFRLEVTTRADRLDAAGFYLALGFQERPRRLIKPL